MLIEINLLPDSYYKAKRLKRIIALAVLGAIVVVASMAGLYIVAVAQVASLNGKIKDIEKSREEFSQTLAKIDSIKKTKAQVDDYLGVINELKEKQVYWPLVLDSFNKTVPNNVWLLALNDRIESGGFRTYTAVGVALFKESIADFVFNLNEPNGFFRNASFTSMTETTINGRLSYNFTIVFQTIEDAKIKPPRQMSVDDVGVTNVYGNNYINKEYNCSIFAPDGWQMNIVGLPANVLVVMAKEKRDLKSKFTPSVSLSVEKLSDQKLTAKAFQAASELKFAKWQGYKKLGEKEFTISGEKVYDLEFNWSLKAKTEKNKTVLLHQRQIYYVKNGFGFVVTCTDVEESFRDNSDEFRIIFNSLKVKEALVQTGK